MKIATKDKLSRLGKCGLDGRVPVMKKERNLKVVWEQETGPDAADRLLKAFEMLLAKAAPTKSVQEGVENYFDRDSLKNDHGRCQEGNDQEYIHFPAQ